MSDELTELKARYDRLNRLYQIGNVIHSTLEPEEALQLIVGESVRAVRASSGSVALINPTNGFLEIQASQGLPTNAAEIQMRVGEGIAGWVVRSGQPARIGNVGQDPRYIMLRGDVRSVLAVPLEVNGEVRGVLTVDAPEQDAFSAADQELLEALAVQAAKAIQNTWRYEQLRLKAGLFESLVNVSRTINSTLSLDDTLTVVAREACTLMRAKMCSLRMLDESHEWLDLRGSFGAGTAYRNKPRLSVEESLLGGVVRRKKPIQVENVQTSSRYQHVELARREGLVSLLSVPLLFAGRCIGTLSVYTGQPYSFSNEQIRILGTLAELSAVAAERARLYERSVDVEEQLRQNEKLSALGLLAAEVAHDIRNPLTVMKMLYHSLNLKFPTGDPRTKDARILGEKIDHLNKIVERILGFARTTEPTLAPVNLNELIEELALLVRHKLANQSVQFLRRLEPNLPPARADAAQLEQAFLNLILNAAEAMPQGGTLTIATGTRRATGRGDSGHSAEETQHVVVKFADTGEGMTEAQRRQAHSSVLKTSKRKGTGLGLAIVQRVVEAHHGQIEIKSRRGRGTTISVLLPLQAELP
jgi:signal transduction histidine kinase